MASPPPSDKQGPFNPLTGDLNDLRLTHEHCWLWPQITAAFDRLDEVMINARTFLEPLNTPACPEWARHAAIGIVRSNAAIHEHAEHHGSYVEAARSLWTTRIPRDPPTLSDAQIYALLAIHETRLAAQTYCEIAAGIEEEMEEAGIGHDDADSIGWLRSEIAGWERDLWQDAAHQTGTAEKFLLMANFAASAPDPVALKKAESQLATLRRKASAAAAAAAPFHQGRQKGAVGRLTRALAVIAREAGSTELSDVLSQIEEVAGEDIEGIRIQEVMDDRIWYLDVIANKEASIAIDSLRRRLRALPDV